MEEFMEVQISKWGNSLGLRIPKDIAVSVGLKEGSRVEITAKGQDVILSKRKPKYTMEELLANTTPEAMREALGDDYDYWQSSVGREIIED